MRLEKITNIVKNILENEPDARSDDMYLYYLFCTKYGFISDNNFYKILKIAILEMIQIYQCLKVYLGQEEKYKLKMKI